MGSKRYKPMTLAEFAAKFGVSPDSLSALESLLRGLELSGDVVQIKHGRYAAPGRLNLIVGKLMCNARGFGFIVPLRRGAFEDVYVSGENMGAAMHEDIVAARCPQGRGRRRSAEIVDVVKHARAVLIGTYEKREKLSYVAPDHAAYFRDIYVAREDRGGAQTHDKVAARITAWPSRHLPPQGKIIEVLGRHGAPGVDVRSVIYEFGLPHEFDDETLAEVRDIPDRVSPPELKGRLDLRNEITFTVDPEEAKDYDDAVSISRKSNGEWLLGVHIADVSHYVPEGSAIDRDAFERGTSVYLPGHVLPMLPEKLSNRMCSLMEGRTRLTKSVLMAFGPDGKLKNSRIRQSVIRSKKRMTYKQLLEILEGDRASKGVPQKVARAARLMAELSKLIRKRRLERGMLELDMPEPRLELDSDGKVTSVERAEGDAAHRLIEDFMLSANEAVAEHMARRKMPALCRAHPPPDPVDTKELSKRARGLGYSLPVAANRKHLQRLLHAARGRPDEYAITLMLLRSLKRAVYQAEWGEHYGLAAKRYTHFTSPIRRYPDLLVHRMLDIDLSGMLARGAERHLWEEKLPEWTEHCSLMERRAENAERELIKSKLLEYLKQFQDQVFDAIVVGVEEYGLWVELPEYMVDGLIHVRNLTDDFYKVDRYGTSLRSTRGRKFVIGQQLKVRIASIDDLKRRLDLVPVSRR